VNLQLNRFAIRNISKGKEKKIILLLLYNKNHPLLRFSCNLSNEVHLHCKTKFILACIFLFSYKAVFPVVFRTDAEWSLCCGNIFAYGNDSHVAEMRLGII
jgi:hypothetical protein